jgi:alpha-1,2-mannosyltransferase
LKDTIERFSITAVVAIAFTIIIAQGLAAILYHIFEIPDPPPVFELAFASPLIILLSAPAWVKSESPLWAGLITVGLSIVGSFVIFRLVPNSIIAAGSLLVVCPLASLGGWYLIRKLPSWINGTLKRSPIKSVLWFILIVLTTIQLVRLSSWVVDSNNNWNLGTWEPLSENHLCIAAYVYAADLNRQGIDNIYDLSLYPGLNPDAVTKETVDGLIPEDPYQYPPQFLILPRFALMITNSFDIIRIAWFVIQVIGFIILALWLAGSVGGDRGKSAIWLIPAAIISFQFTSNFQYGQFHLFSIMLGITGLLLFEKKHYALGGTTLGFAILAKITPGILLIWLMARRKWKEVGWTIAACAACTIIALAVVGTKPFISFFADHLPNMQSGAAFAFGDVWPDIRELMIVSNQSPQMIITRLGELGLPGMSTGLGSLFQALYVLAVVSLAVMIGLKARHSRHSVLVGLALLNLAVIFSPNAPGEYYAVGSIWLLTFMIPEFSENIRRRIFLLVCWLFIGLALGVYLIDGVDLFPTAAIITLISFAAMVLLNASFALQKA